MSGSSGSSRPFSARPSCSLFLLFSGGLSREATLAAAALAAVSPALTYYSRFYIQETLLVFFLAALIGAGWRYAKKRSALWAVVAGAAAGLMFATKETSLVLFAGLAAAFVLLSLIGAPRGPSSRGRHGRGRVGLAGSPDRGFRALFTPRSSSPPAP